MQIISNFEDVLSGKAISDIYEYKTGTRISSETVKDGSDDEMANYVVDGFIKSLAETISDGVNLYIRKRHIYRWKLIRYLKSWIKKNSSNTFMAIKN